MIPVILIIFSTLRGSMKSELTAHTITTAKAFHAAWQAFIARRPVFSAIMIFSADIVISVVVGLAAKAFLPQLQPEFATLVAMTVLVALTLSLLGWWKVAGFNAPSEWREKRLVLIPFLIVIGLPFLNGIQTSDWGTFAYLVLGYALTGIMEEGLMRGIVLQVLKPTGITRSVVISSLLFGLLHITNFLFRSPVIVLAQMLGAFVQGIGFAAIRLRTNTIWFVVILHGLHDLLLKYTKFPPIPLDVVQVTLTMIYGIYILRSWKKQDIQ